MANASLVSHFFGDIEQELVGKFIPEAIGKDIEKACNGIYPLQNVYIRKVKVLKVMLQLYVLVGLQGLACTESLFITTPLQAPKFDLMKLMEVHGDYAEEAPAKVERPAEPIPGSEPVEA